MPRLSRVDIALTLLLTVSFDALTWWSVEISVFFALLLRILSLVVCYYLSITRAIIEPISTLWSTILKHEVKMGIVFVLVVSCAVSSYVRCLGAGVLTFRCLFVLDFLDKIEKYCNDLLYLAKGSALEGDSSSITDSHISSASSQVPASQHPNISISVQDVTNAKHPNSKPSFLQANSAPKSQMRSSSHHSSPRSISTSSGTQSYAEQPKPHLSVIQSPPYHRQPLQRQQQVPEEERRVSRKHGRDDDDDENPHPLYDTEKLSLVPVPAPKARRVVVHPFQTPAAGEESLMDIVVAGNNNKKTTNSHTAQHRPVLKRKVNSHQEEDIEVIQDWMEDNSRTKRRKFLGLEELARPQTVAPASKGASSFPLPAASASSTASTFGSTFAFDSSSGTVSAPKHVSFTVSTNGNSAPPSAPALSAAATSAEAPFTFSVPSSTSARTSAPTDDKPQTSSSSSVAPSSSAAGSGFSFSKPTDTSASAAKDLDSGDKPSFGFLIPQVASATVPATSSAPAFNLVVPSTNTTSAPPTLSIPPISSAAKDNTSGGMFSLPSPSRRPPTAPSPSSQANKGAVPFGIAFSGKGDENRQLQSQANASSGVTAAPFTFGSSIAASTTTTATTTFGFPSSNPSAATTSTETKTSSGFSAPAASNCTGGPFSSVPLPSNAGPSFPGFGSSSAAPSQQSSRIFGGLAPSSAPFSATSTVASSFGSSATSTVTSGTASLTSTVTLQQNPFGATTSFPSGENPPSIAPTSTFDAAFGKQASANPFATSTFPATNTVPAATSIPNTAPALNGSGNNALNPFAPSTTQQQISKGGFGFDSGATVSASAPAPAASNPFSSSMASFASSTAAPNFGGGSAAFAGNMKPGSTNPNPFGSAHQFGSSALTNRSGLPLAPTLSSNPSFNGFGSSSAASSAGNMQFAGALGTRMSTAGQGNAGFGGDGGGGGGFGGDFNGGGASTSMLFQSKGPPKGKLLTKKISSHKK